MHLAIPAHVIVTSIVGVFHVTDVTDRFPAGSRQWFSDSPVTLTDEPSLAFGLAAARALDSARDDRITRDVWLVMGGVVTDHARVTA